MLVLNIVLIFVTCLALFKAASLTIRALTFIAQYFGWHKFVVSFVVMAVATSLPEFFVGVSSAIQKRPQLSLGNIIGASIINLTLILGLCAILAKKIKIEDKKISKNITIALILGFLPVILALDGELSRFDGAVLLLAFLFYFGYIFYEQKKMPWDLKLEAAKGLTKNIFIFFFGFLLLLFLSNVVVGLAQKLTLGLNLPLVVVGLVVVALGTEIPELVFGLKAAIKKHQDLSLGNSLGTIVVNSTFILGVVSLIYPIKIIYFFEFLLFSLFLLLAITIFYIFVRTKKEIDWKEGVFLVLFYLVFVIFQLI